MSEISARRPVTQTIALVLAVLYGCVSISGGIIGYAKADSLPSLIAGGTAGLLLLICAAVVLSRPFWGLIGAAVISIGMLGKFVPVVVQAQGGQSMREGQLETAIVMTVGGGLVLLACALALGSRSGSSGGCCGK